MKRTTWLWLFLTAVLLAAGGVGLVRLLTPASPAARVTKGTAVESVSGTVTVLPESESQIAAPDNGILKDSVLKDGLAVTTGDVLGTIDPGDLPFHIQEDKANLADMDLRLSGNLPSEERLIGAKKLKDDADKLQAGGGYVSEVDKTRILTDMNEAQADATADRSDLETKKKVLVNDIAQTEDQIRRLQILAPYNGTITAVYAFKGDSLVKGKAVAKIVSRELKISAEVNQDDVDAVRNTKTAQIRFFALPNSYFPAHVKMLLPSSDPTTQRFTVLLELDPTSEQLAKKIIAGLTGEVDFQAGEHKNALLIPRRALFGKDVIVVNKDNHVEVRKITTGYLSLSQAEIKKGLQEGELVLTENLDTFRDGEKVRVTNIESPPAPAKDDQP